MNVHQEWPPEALRFCRDISENDLRQLPFRKPVFAGIDNRDLIRQSHCYRKIKEKLPSWWKRGDLIFPDTRVIEQAGSEWTSLWKREKFGSFGGIWIDASAGLGVDTWAMGTGAIARLLLEPDEDRAFCLRHNLPLLTEKPTQVFSEPFPGPVWEAVLPGAPVRIYADPDRRQPDGGRLAGWEDSLPSVRQLYQSAREHGASLLVKLSPMDDPEAVAAELPGVKNVWVLSVNQEVKEVLLMWQVPWSEGPAPEIEVADIRKDGTWQEVSVPPPATLPGQSEPRPGQILLDPWPGLRKNQWATRLAAAGKWEMLSREGQLFQSSGIPEGFPGRCFRIEETFTGLHAFVRRHRPRDLHVVCRNFPLTGEELVRRNKWVERGEQYLFCYRKPDGSSLFVYAGRLARPEG